jgi:hypothetical protein
MRRIAWMDSFREEDPNAKARVKAFLQVMEKLGWAVGSNLAIDYRWNLFDVERARLAGAEILNLGPDVILCGGTPSALAMQQATRTVPIVFAFVTDPVGQGIVTNLARPSSNITGFSYFEPRSHQSGWSCSWRSPRRSGAWRSCSIRCRAPIPLCITNQLRWPPQSVWSSPLQRLSVISRTSNRS